MNMRVMPILECEREVGIELQPSVVGIPVDPSLGIGLCALDRAHVVRFSVIYGVNRQLPKLWQ